MKNIMYFIFCLTFCLSSSAADFYGFQLLNLTNLKAETKCSGVLLNTDDGCKAITNAHCIKGLAIGEENLIISKPNNSTSTTPTGKKLFSDIVFNGSGDIRSHLIKAKPSMDIAEIHFEDEWAPKFCSSKTKFSLDYIFPYEDYSKPIQPQNNPNDPVLNSSRRGYIHPTPENTAKSYCLIASGFQKNDATLFSYEGINFDSIEKDPQTNSFLCPKSQTVAQRGSSGVQSSRLYINDSGLPGLDNMYKVYGVPLAQGMSGGALLNITNLEKSQSLKFSGLAANFIPYQRVSNFIPSIDVLDFLISYIDDHHDQYNIENKIEDTQIASDEAKNFIVKPINSTPKPSENYKPITTLKVPSSNSPRPRVPLGTSKFGDTDQDDVDDTSKFCLAKVDNKQDPKFDHIPSVSSCIDLAQTRFHHEGVLNPFDNQTLIIGYGDKHINGYSDFKKLQLNIQNPLETLITREVNGYPSFEIRKNLINRLSGVYQAQSYENSNFDYGKQHINTNVFKKYKIIPSKEVLNNERINYNIITKDLSKRLLYSPIHKDLLDRPIETRTELAVLDDEIRVIIDSDYRDTFNFKIRNSPDYKYLYLDLKVTRLDFLLNDVTNNFFNRTSISLVCDNRNFKKLICTSPYMEFGISEGEFRLSFWNKLMSKRESLASKNPSFIYSFGKVTRKTYNELSRQLNDFNKVKYQNVTKLDNYQALPGSFIRREMDIVSLPKRFKELISCSFSELTSSSFLVKDKIFHILHDNNQNCSPKKRRVNAVIYDKHFNVVAITKKGRFTTDNLFILGY